MLMETNQLEHTGTYDSMRMKNEVQGSTRANFDAWAKCIDTLILTVRSSIKIGAGFDV